MSNFANYELSIGMHPNLHLQIIEHYSIIIGSNLSLFVLKAKPHFYVILWTASKSSPSPITWHTNSMIYSDFGHMLICGFKMAKKVQITKKFNVTSQGRLARTPFHCQGTYS